MFQDCVSANLSESPVAVAVEREMTLGSRATAPCENPPRRHCPFFFAKDCKLSRKQGASRNTRGPSVAVTDKKRILPRSGNPEPRILKGMTSIYFVRLRSGEILKREAGPVFFLLVEMLWRRVVRGGATVGQGIVGSAIVQTGFERFRLAFGQVLDIYLIVCILYVI